MDIKTEAVSLTYSDVNGDKITVIKSFDGGCATIHSVVEFLADALIGCGWDKDNVYSAFKEYAEER